MDGYRIVGEDSRAELYAREVIRSVTEADGTERKPMRIAEARLTLAVIAARAGELEKALTLGRRAFSGERKSLPSLLMVSSELTEILGEQYASQPSAVAFLDTVRALGATSSQDHSAS